MGDESDPELSAAFADLVAQLSNKGLAECIKESIDRRHELGYVSLQLIEKMRQRMADARNVGEPPPEMAAAFEQLLESIDEANVWRIDLLARTAAFAVSQNSPPAKNIDLDEVRAWAIAHDAVYGFDPLNLDQPCGA